MKERLASLSKHQGFTFEWSDSALIRAAERGEWISIDGANKCSASVLDRLNGLFEDGGVLAVTEGGCGEDQQGVRIIRPHRDFRIFLTMDPRHGELSAAMRNRCVEIHVPPDSVTPASKRIFASSAPSEQEEVGSLSDASTIVKFETISNACGLVTAIKGEHVTPRHTLPSTVGDISSHPQAETAVFQLEALLEQVKVRPPQGKRQVISSFLKFADKETVELRLGLLQDKCSLSDLGETLKSTQLDEADSPLLEPEENRLAFRLHLLTANPSVLPSPSAKSVDLLELTSAIDTSVLKFLEQLKSLGQSRPDLFSSENNNVRLWQSLVAVNVMRDGLLVAASKSQMDIVAAVCKRKIYQVCKLLDEATAEHILATCFSQEKGALALQVGSNWRFGGGKKTGTLPTKKECLQMKEFLTFASGLSPFLSQDSLEELRRRLSEHQVFLAKASSSPHQTAKITSANDLAAAELEDLAASGRNIVTLARETHQDSFAILPCTLHPLPLKLSISLGSTRKRLSWSWLQRSNALLNHYFLRVNDFKFEDIKALTSLNPSKENDGATLERISDTLTSMSATYWLANKNMASLKAANLQSWRLLEEIAEMSFREALSCLGYCGDREVGKVDYVKNLQESLTHDAPESVQQALRRATEKCFQRRNVKDDNPVGAAESMMAGAITLVELLRGYMTDRRAVMEAEVSRLRAEAEEARLCLKADLVCYKLSRPLDEAHADFIEQNPIHVELARLAQDNEAEAASLTASLPARIEPREELELEVKGLLEGPMAPDFLWMLAGQIQEDSEVGKAAATKVASWKKSLLNFVQDVEVKFSSYQDLIGVLSAAIFQALLSIDILLRHFNGRRMAEAEKIVRLDSLKVVTDAICGVENFHQGIFAPTDAYVPSDFDLIQTEFAGRRSLVAYHDHIAKNASIFPVKDAMDLPPKQEEGISTRDLLGSHMISKSLCRVVQSLNLSNFGHLSEARKALLESMVLTLRRAIKSDSTKGDLLAAVEPIKSARSTVANLLRDHWPDNPVLTDIEAHLTQLLTHTVWDTQRGFQLALEEAVKQVETWNADCPARYNVPVAELRSKVEVWKREAVMSIKRVYEEICVDVRDRGLRQGMGVLHLCERIFASCDASNKRAWVAAVILNFIHSSYAQDHSSKVQVLVYLQKVYRGLFDEVEAVLQTFRRLNEPYGGKVKEEISSRKKGCDKTLANSVKLLLVNRESNFVKIGRERSKKVKECLEIVRRPIPALTSDVEELLTDLEAPAIPQVTQVSSNLLLQFQASDGTPLGNSLQLAQMSAKFVRDVASKIGERKGGLLEEEVESVKSLLASLKAADKDSKREVYAAKKTLEALMKSLRQDQGLSDRQGNLHDGLTGFSAASVCSGYMDDGITKCLVAFDQMRKSMREHADNLGPRFEERAVGMARHALLRLIDFGAGAASLGASLKAMKGSLDSMSHFNSAEKRKMKTILNRLGLVLSLLEKMPGKHQDKFNHSTKLLECKSELQKATSVSQHAGTMAMCALKKSGNVLYELCQDYGLLKEAGSLRVYDECRQAKLDVDRLLSRVADLSNSRSESDEAHSFESYLRGTVTKCLKRVKAVQKLVGSSQIASAKVFENSCIAEILSVLDHTEVVEEIHFLTTLRLSRSDNDLLLEARPVFETYRQLCQTLWNWTRQECSGVGGFVTDLCRCFAYFATIAPVKSGDDDGEGEGEEEGTSHGKDASSGVGLGEGEGDKATTEGVESEDLFENPQDEDGKEKEEQQQQKDSGDDKDDYVDYSDQLQEDRLTDEEKEDDDGEKEEEEDEDMSDMEGEAKGEEEQHKKEDLLDSEDWKQNENEEDDEKKEQEGDDQQQADFVSEDMPEVKDDRTNDMVNQEEDEEKRDRLPDAEEDHDIEDQMDDGKYNNQEEPDVEDFDMEDNDQGVDELDGEDSDGDSDMEVEGNKYNKLN